MPATASEPTRTVTAGHVLAVLAVGAAVRFALLRVPFLWPDEATIARMGLAVLRGEFPVYFHGQPFMGALDAYLLAPLYVTVGAAAFAVELLPALLSVAWLGLMARRSTSWQSIAPNERRRPPQLGPVPSGGR